MCTNIALGKTNGAITLAKRLGVDPEALRYGDDFGPGSVVSIVVGTDDGPALREAKWWLYLKQTDHGLKPDNRYFSVNTNHEKLPAKPEFSSARCVVPATAFVESQDGKRPHLLKRADGGAIAWGGLWKRWYDKATGEEIYSASIITLAGHPALENIHRKSVPLWLPEDELDAWLDPSLKDTSVFRHLLEPHLCADLRATPIDKARSKVPIGEAFRICA